MAKYNENNPLQKWINEDIELLQILDEIEIIAKSEKEKALIAFHKISEHYSLPKYPCNIETRDTIQVDDFHLFDQISMYEALGKIIFADKNSENLKSNVLLAAFIVKNKFEPNIDEELDTFLGNEYLMGFGYKGKDVDVEMIPIKEGESWIDKGCEFFVKYE
ncbi:hypothetical protein [Flavobacterium sp.]|uniref:hypothetical protein n=1 Tax=Flavobacterium sp. TaxID=239 RepID=UPI00262403EE|nr:hypothetical protein [Flavobacterium sp.]